MKKKTLILTGSYNYQQLLKFTSTYFGEVSHGLFTKKVFSRKLRNFMPLKDRLAYYCHLPYNTEYIPFQYYKIRIMPKQVLINFVYDDNNIGDFIVIRNYIHALETKAGIKLQANDQELFDKLHDFHLFDLGN